MADTLYADVSEWQVGVDDLTSSPGGGQIRGDQSSGINAVYDAVGAFVGSTAKVIGYGNGGDLNNLWPQTAGHRPMGSPLRITPVPAVSGRRIPCRPRSHCREFRRNSEFE